MDEKQVVTGTLLKSLQNLPYNNIVATSNHKFDQTFCKNIGCPQGEKKEINSIDDKSIQIHDDNSNNSGINNQETIRESKENQSKALDNSVDNSNDKEITEQPNGSLRVHPDHIDGVKSTGKEKKKTVAIVGDCIIGNIRSCSLNNSLNECFSIITSFSWATTKDMGDCIKPSMARKHKTWEITSNHPWHETLLSYRDKRLKNNKTLSDIASEIIQLAKSIKTKGIEVAFSSLIPHGDKPSEKAEKVNIHLQEKSAAEKCAIIQHTNVNTKPNLFPDKWHLNKKGQGILKGNFRRFIYDCKFWCFSQRMILLLKIEIYR